MLQWSEKDLKQRGLKVSPDPHIQRRPWVNKRTGEEQQVPVGIDPGWDHNAVHEVTHVFQGTHPRSFQRPWRDLHTRRITRDDGTRLPLEQLSGYEGIVMGYPTAFPVEPYASMLYHPKVAPAFRKGFKPDEPLEVVTTTMQILLTGNKQDKKKLGKMLRDDPELVDLGLDRLFNYDP